MKNLTLLSLFLAMSSSLSFGAQLVDLEKLALTSDLDQKIDADQKKALAVVQQLKESKASITYPRTILVSEEIDKINGFIIRKNRYEIGPRDVDHVPETVIIRLVG